MNKIESGREGVNEIVQKERMPSSYAFILETKRLLNRKQSTFFFIKKKVSDTNSMLPLKFQLPLYLYKLKRKLNFQHLFLKKIIVIKRTFLHTLFLFPVDVFFFSILYFQRLLGKAFISTVRPISCRFLRAPGG